MNSGHVTDIDFLGQEVARREHFLYVYKENSALLRSKVRAHIQTFAERSGWHRTNLSGGTLEGQLNAPFWLGEMFVVCDAADFKLDDLNCALDGIAHRSFQHHVLLMVRERSKVLEQPE